MNIKKLLLKKKILFVKTYNNDKPNKIWIKTNRIENYRNMSRDELLNTMAESERIFKNLLQNGLKKIARMENLSQSELKQIVKM